MIPTYIPKSAEGIDAYKKINYPYPQKIQDEVYEEFLRKTRGSPEELNQNVIHKMVRVQSSFVDRNHDKDFEEENPNLDLEGDPREYIVYEMSERRLDALNNEVSAHRSNLGMYERPIPHYAIKRDEEGRSHKYISSVNGTIAYSIPFTKKNVDKIRKEIGGVMISDDPKLIAKENFKRQKAAEKINAAIGLGNSANKTRYYVTKEDDERLITVESLKDFMEGSFEDLWHFGRAHVSKQMWEQRKAAQEVAAVQKIMAAGGFTSEAEAQQRMEEAVNRKKTAGEVYT